RLWFAGLFVRDRESADLLAAPWMPAAARRPRAEAADLDALGDAVVDEPRRHRCARAAVRQRRAFLALAREAFLLLLDDLAAQLAQPRLDDRRLVEVRVASLGGELELDDRALDVAAPGVELALVEMLLQALPRFRIGTGGDAMQLAITGEALELRF